MTIDKTSVHLRSLCLAHNSEISTCTIQGLIAFCFNNLDLITNTTSSIQYIYRLFTNGVQKMALHFILLWSGVIWSADGPKCMTNGKSLSGKEWVTGLQLISTQMATFMETSSGNSHKRKGENTQDEADPISLYLTDLITAVLLSSHCRQLVQQLPYHVWWHCTHGAAASGHTVQQPQ